MNREELNFLKEGIHIVYPGQGVGIILTITQQDIAGIKLDTIILNFAESKMNITVPLFKVKSSGMRPLSSPHAINTALKILAATPKISKLPWIRRQDQYETKINSGNINKLAETLRDLNQELIQADNNYSYTKLALFKKALERLSQEISAVENTTVLDVATKLENILGNVLK